MTRWNTLPDEIPQRYLADLTARAPSMPLAMFRFAVSRYMDGDTDDKPATVRDELDRLADASIRLSTLLGELSLTASDSLAAREVKHGCAGLSQRLRDDLRALMGVAEMARRDVEQSVSVGRGLSPNTQLVRDLARGLRMNGATADDRPNGELVQAFGIALSVAGKQVADPAGTVKSALHTLGKE